MNEATKTNAFRGEAFRRRFFSGRVIDVGCGADLVVPHAVAFDLPQGDAERILNYHEPESFDCVHSSHCLEHMNDVPAALAGWWAAVKPGGYLVIVVPDEDLYEQGIWPSLFNEDHKATFSFRKKSTSWSPVSYDIEALVAALPDAEIIEASLQDQGYRHWLRWQPSAAVRLFLYRWGGRRERLFRWLMRRGFPLQGMNAVVSSLEMAAGRPVDQTLGAALAQIQVVARKRAGRE